MKQNTLFTIGHSNRTKDEFLSLLVENGITAVADVRSHPYSRRNPQFNKEQLADSLKAIGIEHVFLGEELGARRIEPECYENGKARYCLIAKCPLFRIGLDRIRSGLQSHSVAMMCAELDPLTCHRTILVCRYLKSTESIKHILERGKLEDHAEAEYRLLKLVGLSPNDLFQSLDEQIDYAYDLQGDKLAYVQEPMQVQDM